MPSPGGESKPDNNSQLNLDALSARGKEANTLLNSIDNIHYFAATLRADLATVAQHVNQASGDLRDFGDDPEASIDFIMQPLVQFIEARKREIQDRLQQSIAWRRETAKKHIATLLEIEQDDTKQAEREARLNTLCGEITDTDGLTKLQRQIETLNAEIKKAEDRAKAEKENLITTANNLLTALVIHTGQEQSILQKTALSTLSLLSLTELRSYVEALGTQLKEFQQNAHDGTTVTALLIQTIQTQLTELAEISKDEKTDTCNEFSTRLVEIIKCRNSLLAERGPECTDRGELIQGLSRLKARLETLQAEITDAINQKKHEEPFKLIQQRADELSERTWETLNKLYGTAIPGPILAAHHAHVGFFVNPGRHTISDCHTQLSSFKTFFNTQKSQLAPKKDKDKEIQYKPWPTHFLWAQYPDNRNEPDEKQMRNADIIGVEFNNNFQKP